MSDPLQRALVSVRASVRKGERLAFFARSHRGVLGKSWSFDVAEPELTGAETLLGLLAADVIGLFLKLAAQRRVAVDEIEATVKAELRDALAHLGVVGAAGEPRYDGFSLRVYAGSAASGAVLQEIWSEALRRAPLAGTLRRAASLDAVLQVQS
jgi:hypothetical protein